MENNLLQLLKNTVDKHGENYAFSSKDGKGGYNHTNYKDFYQKTLTLMVGLKSIGVQKGDKVFMFCDNRIEWIMTDFALQGIEAVSVPRGTDTGASEVEFILNHSEAKYIVIENAKAEKKLESLKTNAIKIAIDDNIQNADFYFSKIMETGEKEYEANKQWAESRHAEVAPETLVTIIYTSGTTGNPKGVMLTQHNFVYDVVESPKNLTIYPTDRVISIMPIWHVFERTVEYCMVLIGANVVYSSIKTFLNDLDAVKPTMIVVVPRVLETFYEKIQIKLHKLPFLAKIFFNTIYGCAYAFFKMRLYIKSRILFFKKKNQLWSIINRIGSWFVWPAYLISRKMFTSIHKVLGGNVRVIISGGGSLPLHIDAFFNFVGLHLTDGYGLTETSPIVVLRNPDKYVIGTCGTPIPGIDVKLVKPDGTECSYGEKGELAVKGDVVMQGYYKNPEATNAAIRDGWFYTGDLALHDYYGYYKILGRLKDTIVLRGGENVEPTVIENVLNKIYLVSNSIVFGQDQKRLKALIALNKEEVINFAKLNNIPSEDYEALSNSAEVKKELQKEIDEHINANPEIKPFEKLYEFSIIPKTFDIGDELTNTLKLKRFVVMEKYKDIIDSMLEKK